MILLLWWGIFIWLSGGFLDSCLSLTLQRKLGGDEHLSMESIYSDGCPCSDVRLCQRVSVQYKQEIFGFVADDNYKNYDFDTITAIAWSTKEEIMCYAHAHGVRIIGKPPAFNLSDMGDKSLRQEFIKKTIAIIEGTFIDGLTFDFESPLDAHSKEREYYTALVSETAQAIHESLPNSQVSVCVAWSPDSIDGRNYDYLGLSQHVDFFYQMVYDTQSQIFGRCIANANAPFSIAVRGVERYLEIGIPIDKLVLGVPWYGYDYPCINSNQMIETKSNYCELKKVAFRGVNCSDAAGGEVSFNLLKQRLRSQQANTSSIVQTKRDWDHNLLSPFFTYFNDNDNSVHQVWYDDPASLKIKYLYAKKMGLRGIGPFTWAYLGYDTPEDRIDAEQMWEALKIFANKDNKKAWKINKDHPL